MHSEHWSLSPVLVVGPVFVIEAVPVHSSRSLGRALMQLSNPQCGSVVHVDMMFLWSSLAPCRSVRFVLTSLTAASLACRAAVSHCVMSKLVVGVHIHLHACALVLATLSCAYAHAGTSSVSTTKPWKRRKLEKATNMPKLQRLQQLLVQHPSRLTIWAHLL